MDPVTVMMGAFSAIKAGVSAGKEIHDLGKQIGTLFDAIDETKVAHSNKKNRAILSVNEEAMSTFIAKKKAEDLESQLREMIVMTRGHSAWQELLRLRVDIKNKRKEELRRLERERKERIEGMMLLGAVGLVAAAMIGTFAYLIKLKMDGAL